jgi:Ca-activated chloride channel family protein
MQSGNEFYRKQQFDQALTEYNKAIDSDPNDPNAKFNQANAFYKQDKKVEAAKAYAAVINASTQKDMRNRAWYNKGVVLTQEKNLEESIEAYKNALRNDPNDKEARENLQKALLELKKKQPPPPKKENNKNQKQQQKQQQQKMSNRESEQRLQLLEQKEKEVQQRIQKEKSQNSGGGKQKDW